MIKFKCPKLLKFHGKLNSNQNLTMNNDQNLISNSTLSNALDKYVTYEYDDREFIITFIVQLPNEGQYGIDLYARDPEYQAEKRTMSHCCKYIINYSRSSTVDTTHNNLYHDYSFDSPRSNGQQKIISPRINSISNQPERSLSPRK
jgi:hypothetical protein